MPINQMNGLIEYFNRYILQLTDKNIKLVLKSQKTKYKHIIDEGSFYDRSR